MCTVTYLPTREGCYLTSNRDEQPKRKIALPPAIYAGPQYSLLYPKDAAAGGSWIAASQNGNAAVLLNGAFNPHIPNPPYSRSRGLVFLDIIGHPTPAAFFTLLNLQGIEPFTLVLFQQGKLYECRWDAVDKHCKALDATEPHIWSSATLYSPAIIQKRQSWFSQWLQQQPIYSAASILAFHQFAGDGDGNNDVLMNRNGLMQTVSITCMHISKQACQMKYADLLNEQQAEAALLFNYRMTAV
ncbi:MAG: hypothetical protein RL172_1217 [Bacteroidota bacterium]|jgi:hypothetical protein